MDSPIPVTRSLISEALFDLLKNAYKWGTADSRLRLPDDVANFEMPALFLAKPAEELSQHTFGLTKHHFRYYAMVILRSDSIPTAISERAEAEMDAILDAIEHAINPSSGVPSIGRAQPQTLGGLVTNAWIDGTVHIDSPIFFETCAILIPISVVTGILK